VFGVLTMTRGIWVLMFTLCWTTLFCKF